MTRKCSTLSPYVSAIPNIMVAVVRIPSACAVSWTSTHFAVGTFVSDQTRRRTESSRISAPPPGIDWRPASKSRAITSCIDHFVIFFRK